MPCFQMKFLIILFLTVTSIDVLPQENYYTNPVKIPIFLSGSFAELRSNHFHSGIDIKTQRKIGFPVHSVAEGFISRIVVSPTGFGKALYIDHPNGTTSVYAHLDNFREDIKKYIKNLQYEKKTFRIDVKVPENQFKVKQDEIIATTGNSGSSGGPHLHFEIRDTQSEEPLNPLQFNFAVKDNIAPQLYSIMLVPMNDFSHVDFNPEKKIYPVININGKYQLKEKTVVPVYGNIGIAIQANDFFDGSENRCGIYSLKLWFDGELYYSHQMDRFSFEETRYINSFIDYGEYVTSRRRFQKTWIEPGNRLSIYSSTQRGGNLKMTDGNFHPVKIELKDLNGNTSVLEFTLVSRYMEIQRLEPQFASYLRYDRHNEFIDDDIALEFPENVLYNDLMFNYKKIPHSNPFLSAIHIIHDETTPLHDNVLLSVKTETFNKKYHEKSLLVKVDTLTGKFTSAGGSYENGWVTGHIRSFGNYAVAVDTIPPVVIPLSLGSNGELTESSRIRFRITDELSGIKDYEAMLDGKWALFEYDAKINTITHNFDRERFEFGKRHTLILTVTDFKNNKTIYEASFWK